MSTTDDRPGYLDDHSEAIGEVGYLAGLLAMAIDELGALHRDLALRQVSVQRALRCMGAGDVCVATEKIHHTLTSTNNPDGPVAADPHCTRTARLTSGNVPSRHESGREVTTPRSRPETGTWHPVWRR